ncbi:unnamed protein product [Caretta caretta]
MERQLKRQRSVISGNGAEEQEEVNENLATADDEGNQGIFVLRSEMDRKSQMVSKGRDDVSISERGHGGATVMQVSCSVMSCLPQCPHWHRIALGVGWAGNVILAGAVIVLGVWVTKGSRLEDFPSQLKQMLCVSSHSNSTEGAECKLCPMDWLLHRRKCYWVSKEFKNWKKSFEDCTVKTSQMLVIQDQDEMVKKI